MSSSLEKEFNLQVQNFITELKHDKVAGSYNVALGTVSLLRKLIGTTRWSNAKELIESIQTFGKNIIKFVPSETSVGNMVRRVLKFVREEYSGTVGNDHEG